MWFLGSRARRAVCVCMCSACAVRRVRVHVLCGRAAGRHVQCRWLPLAGFGLAWVGDCVCRGRVCEWVRGEPACLPCAWCAAVALMFCCPSLCSSLCSSLFSVVLVFRCPTSCLLRHRQASDVTMQTPTKPELTQQRTRNCHPKSHSILRTTLWESRSQQEVGCTCSSFLQWTTSS
jgi:hypothetical protein